MSVNEVLINFFETIGRIVCHQMSERSLWVGGHYLPVCARCTGAYLGFYIGYLILPFRNKKSIGPPNIYITLSMVAPIVIDGFGQFFGLWISTNDLRLVTGLLFGTSISPFLIYLLSILPSKRRLKMIRGIIPIQIDLGKIKDPWIGYRAFVIGLSLVAILFFGIKAIIGSTYNILYWTISFSITASIIIHIFILPIFVIYSVFMMIKI